jgi:hypothetical protein
MNISTTFFNLESIYLSGGWKAGFGGREEWRAPGKEVVKMEVKTLALHSNLSSYNRMANIFGLRG